MRSYKLLFAGIIIGFVTLTVTTFAGAPPMINLQGKLTDDAGIPVADGNYWIRFKIFDDPAIGTELWSTGGYVKVSVEEGLFNHLLGSNVPIPHSLSDNDSLWVEMKLDGFAEMTPRIRLSSVMWAMGSMYSDTADVAQEVVCTGCITFSNIGSNGAGEGEVMKMIGGNWAAAADETGGGGDITGVNAGSGLTGGGFSGDVTIDVDTAGIIGSMLAANAVTSAKIQDNTIDSTDLADEGIPLRKLANSGAGENQGIAWTGSGWEPYNFGTITGVLPGQDGGLEGGGYDGKVQLWIDNNGVTTPRIATDAVTADKIAADAVGSSEIATGAVDTDELATGAVWNVDIADNAVTAGKIMDEPGVAHSFLTSFNIETTVSTADSVVITVPSSGYMVVSVSGYVVFGHDGDDDFVKVSLSKTKGSIDDQNLAHFRMVTGTEIGLFHDSFSIVVVDVLPSSGEYKYYVTTDENFDSIFTESYLRRLHITAVFYPTAYGAVNDQI